MNLHKPERCEALAAEYVLGTLRGPARRRFERCLAHDDGLRDEVQFWEQRLAQFAEAVPPLPPPPLAWAQLEQELGLAELPQSAQIESRRLRRRSRLRRLAAAASLAASLTVAFVVGQNHPKLTAFQPPDPPLPMYVTTLQAPLTDVYWLVSLSPDRHQLSVEASDLYTQVGRFDIELWCVTPNGPVPLGVLPNHPGAVAAFGVPKGLEGQTVSFAITLEKKGGSPTGRPTGPVLTEARDLGAI